MSGVTPVPGTAPWRLALPGGDGAAITLDPASGLPAALELPGSSGLSPVGCSSELSLHVGGGEMRALGGGLEYPGIEVLNGPKLVAVELGGGGEEGVAAGAPALRASCELASWSVALDYHLVGELPRARLSFGLSRAAGDDRPLRNLELELDLALDPADWLLHAPGNRVAQGCCLADLRDELAISPPTGSLGSIGLVALSHRRAAACLVLWPFSASEIGWITLVPGTGGVRLRVSTNLAADPAPGAEVSYGGLELDARAVSWDELRGEIRPALSSLGVGSPGSKPAWAAAAAIYEVQVGRSVFAGGWGYEPYPRLEDVTADLERVAGLGFDTVQLMPRQPYPSYNVCDYDDVGTTYGGEEALRALVARAHGLGLRVVLDIVLHGVLDRRSIRDALGRVQASGILATPAPVAGDVFADTPASRAALQRAWCQHIVDFGPDWIAGSPEVHPLTSEHPDWFCRDSAGELTGIYTEAFDLADESWQAWFCEKALCLVERFAVDGFRFDAPTYNNFANWSPQRRRRASASSTGCVSLFARLRRELKARHPEVLMFTEPSGVVLRQSMDMNYNYDELWLVPALTGGRDDASAVRSGAQLAAWFDERDTTLPADALTCHHLDSHDTFWWPVPGRKWRREQIGLPATRALTWCLALSGGPFMMFTGGETEMEADLARTLWLRRERPELAAGDADFSAVRPDDDAVFAVLRHRGGTGVLVAVNLSPQAVTATAELRGGWQATGERELYSTRAGGEAAPPARGKLSAGAGGSLRIELEPYGLALAEVAR